MKQSKATPGRKAAITRELNAEVRTAKRRAATRRANESRGPEGRSTASRKAWRTRKK